MGNQSDIYVMNDIGLRLLLEPLILIWAKYWNLRYQREEDKAPQYVGYQGKILTNIRYLNLWMSMSGPVSMSIPVSKSVSIFGSISNVSFRIFFQFHFHIRDEQEQNISVNMYTN